MNRSTAALFLTAGGLLAGACRETPTSSTAGLLFSTGNPVNPGSRATYTLAVIGDFPYGPVKLAELPRMTDLINGDPKVDLVAHLGDIKAGRNDECATSYYETVMQGFDGLKDPFVYTPGDNEWTDCHVAFLNNGLYTPTERLETIRRIFFPVPGQTLGGRKKRVLTQASEAGHELYVENVMWMEARVVFATLHLTGTNNDLAPWGTPLPADAANYPSQAEEFAARAAANRDWLAKDFALAREEDAVGVVLMTQADMWSGGAVNGLTDMVLQIGAAAAAYGRPVLLLEGDTHAFRVDQPYSASSPLRALHPSTPVAENLTRVVVEGGPTGRTEYLRLTIDPKGPVLFNWERVPLE